MLGMAAASPAHAEPLAIGAALAQISLQSGAPGSFTITAEIIALADVMVTAELRVHRKGRAGQVASSQMRSLRLAAGERATIAHLDLSLAAGDELTATAVVRDNDTIISTAVVSTGEGS